MNQAVVQKPGKLDYTKAKCFEGKTIEEARQIRKDFTRKMMEANTVHKKHWSGKTLPGYGL